MRQRRMERAGLEDLPDSTKARLAELYRDKVAAHVHHRWRAGRSAFPFQRQTTRSESPNSCHLYPAATASR